MNNTSFSLCPTPLNSLHQVPDDLEMNQFILAGGATPAKSFSKTSSHQPYAWNIEQPGELVRIFDPDVQIVNWQRQDNDAITTYFEQALTSGILGSGFQTVIRTGERLNLNFLPDLPCQSAVVEDIFLLLDIYSELLGCPAVGFRLEIVKSPMCPRFHIDLTGIRLACAYRGSGTEWIDDRCVNLSKLGAASNGVSDETSGLLDSKATVEAAAPFDVVFFKGKLWQGNEGRGAIHRSPAMMPESGPRILLVMDAIWN